MRQSTNKSLAQPWCGQTNASRFSASKGDRMTQTATAARRLDASVTMRFAASKGQPACIDAPGNTQRQQSCRHTSAICNQEAPYTQSTASTETHPKQLKTTSVAAPVAQTSFYCRLQPLCLKRQCFAPSVPHNANGTFLQSLPRALQHHVTNAHAPMHAARCSKARRQQPCGRSNEICNQKKNHARKVLRVRIHTQSHLKPQSQRGKKKHRRSRALCTQTTFHGSLQPLDLKTQCFAIPQHKSNATFLQPWQWVLQHQVASPHELPDTRKYSLSRSSFFLNASSMQLSCRHYSGFCSITWQACMYL